MSLFQCSKCGCLENSACTRGYHCLNNNNRSDGKSREALASYRAILGLALDEDFGPTCSACCPIWYDEKGDFGIGPNPNPTADKYDGGGLWHGGFPRRFLPKGQFETNAVGNLCHKVTKDTDIKKYELEREEGT